MTICIAAICESGRSLVALADKMITYSAPPYHQFEHPKPKIHELTKNTIFMTSGSALLPSVYIRLIQTMLSQQTNIGSIRDIAEIAKEAYKFLRTNIITDRILGKYGITWGEFKNVINERGLGDLYYKILGEIEDFRVELEAIIAGIDSSGVHIFLIENPGELSSFDDIGYTAIGSGEYHAIRSFIENDYSIDFPLEKALYVIYEAKKYAECAPGVGESTDIVVINHKGIKKIDKNIFSMLDTVYKAKINAIKKIFEEEIQEKLEEVKNALSSEDDSA